MRKNQLPRRIITLTAGVILVFVVTLGAFMISMSRALDVQAWEQSVAQIRDTKNKLLDQITLTTVDWAKWTAGVSEINAGNIGWIQKNLGATVAHGQVMQLATIWGGRYDQEMSWITDVVDEGRAGHLAPGTLELVESRLVSIPVGSYRVVKFFSWQEGALFAVAASRLEDVEEPNALFAADEGLERLLLGRRLSDLDEIADSFQLTGFGIGREAPAERPFVPLFGVDGAPVAYLVWDAPRPGGKQLRKTLPLLLLSLTLAAGLAVLGMALVRRSALQLVWAEQRALEAAQKACSAARTDSLTGIPNRAVFSELIAAPARAGERGILFLDINWFKRINDSIGHAAGDEVIVIVTRRLSRFVAADCVLARLGGDEFVFVVTGSNVEARIKLLTESVGWTFTSRLSVLGHSVAVAMSMGYAIQNEDNMVGDALLHQADLAMYEAKRLKGKPVAFSLLIQQTSTHALIIEKCLRAALHSYDELSIAYQPIVDTNGYMERAEALARWTSPELGPVEPGRFIPVAERGGLILSLGRKLFQIVCDDLVAHPSLRVSVNVSALQLMAPDFVASLVGHLRERRIDPGRVEIELTESVILEDLTLAAERLEELRAAGVSIALDDFGTGFSSMGYLARFPFDTLKIDRSFVSEIRNTSGGVAVMQGMITIAHGLNLRVVCEGVETAQDLELMRELGCDLAQGYHLERPVPIATLARRWLDQSTGIMPAVKRHLQIVQ